MSSPPDRLRRGTPAYRRATRVLFVAGLTTFAAMYGTQALLPELSDAFGVSPAGAALSVSVTTGAIAVSIIPLAVASERIGRTRMMIGASVLFTVVWWNVDHERGVWLPMFVLLLLASAAAA